MTNNKNRLTEEHKKKISESNKKALRKFYDNNPDHRNKGMFKKGQKAWNKGKEMPSIQEENHYKWKGGVKSARVMAKRSGEDMSKCHICKEKTKTVIHHVGGDRQNNQFRNLGVVCNFCHNAIHNAGMKTRFQIGHDVPNEWRNKIGNANKKMEVTI